VLPDDDRIILTIHYYNPFTFTHQGAEWVSGSDAWLGTPWNDTEADRESVESDFNYAIQFSETNNIPIHIGEFGAYSRADMASRERWTTFLARWFDGHKMSWAYWEFSAGFGIYNPATEEYIPGLVDALMHNEMPEPTPVFATPVYTSDFSLDANGWSLIAQGGAAGSLSVGNNRANVSIASAGTETWHLQLVRNNIPLQKGKLYRLSFTGHAQADRSITFYAGRASDPWNAYSSYNSVGLSTEDATYSFIFSMTSPTDPASRLVFDLGTNTSAVEISSIKVEELSFSVTSAQSDVSEQKPSLYPNPVSSYFWIDGVINYDTAEVFDLTGRLRATFKIDGPLTKCDAAEIPSGMYVLSLKGSRNSAKMKFIRE
jgi:hypothetical protein